MDTILFFANFQQVVSRRTEKVFEKGINLNDDVIQEIEAKTANQFFSIIFSPARRSLIRSRGHITMEILSTVKILRRRWTQFRRCSPPGHIIRTAVFKQMAESRLPENVHPEVFWDSLRERKRQKLFASA